MISRIEAYKYRCFDKLDIQVDQCNVIIGLNGTGKSTLLDIPVLLSEILSKGLVPAFLESPSIPGGRRASNLRDLLYKRQGDNFGFAIEAHLPQEVISQLLKSEVNHVVTGRKLHPQYLRYELNLKIQQMFGILKILLGLLKSMLVLYLFASEIYLETSKLLLYKKPSMQYMMN